MRVSNSDRDKIRERIRSLDVRAEDLQGCRCVEEEFTVILRKTSDLKHFCDPSETGYARRIRTINTAHRSLKELYESGAVDSFAQFFDDTENDSDDENHEH